MTTVYYNARENKGTDDEIYVTKDKQDKIKEDMKNKYSFCVHFNLEGLLNFEHCGYVYCDTYEEAKEQFEYYLRKVLKNDDNVDEEEAFFPNSADERKKVFAAYCIIGAWESGASWKVRLLRSDRKFLNADACKAWLVGENLVPEEEYEKSTKTCS